MDRDLMAQRNDREYTNYLRTQRDSPKLLNKEAVLQSKGYQYFIQTSNGRQSIPAYQISKHNTVYIQQSHYATLTPKESAFLIQREIQRNIIRIQVLRRAGRNEEFLQHYKDQNKQLSNQLKDVVY